LALVLPSIYEITTTIGPEITILSVSTPVAGPALVRCTYVTPFKICGTTHAVPSNAANAVPPGTPPFVNAQKVAPVAVLATASLASALISAAAVVEVMAGNGVILRLEPSGHDVMKGAARLKTERGPRGVSNGEGTATALEATRIKV
jgi:hypothetical protein